VRGQDQAATIGHRHLHGVVDDELEHVFDIRVADHRHAQLSQRVRLGRAFHRLAPLPLQLACHVAGRKGHHQEQKDLADGGIRVSGEVGRRERAADK
jgi:hypothetical protein